MIEEEIKRSSLRAFPSCRSFLSILPTIPSDHGAILGHLCHDSARGDFPHAPPPPKESRQPLTPGCVPPLPPFGKATPKAALNAPRIFPKRSPPELSPPEKKSRPGAFRAGFRGQENFLSGYATALSLRISSASFSMIHASTFAPSPITEWIIEISPSERTCPEWVSFRVVSPNTARSNIRSSMCA